MSGEERLFVCYEFETRNHRTLARAGWLAKANKWGVENVQLQIVLRTRTVNANALLARSTQSMRIPSRILYYTHRTFIAYTHICTVFACATREFSFYNHEIFTSEKIYNAIQAALFSVRNEICIFTRRDETNRKGGRVCSSVRFCINL